MQVLSVSELTFAIKSLLEPRFRSLSVRGEISNCKLQASGHLYFSLKDTNSQISAALFKGDAARLARLPKEGDQVVATGSLSLYAPRGQYQLIVRELQLLGVGELLLKLHQLKEALQAKGWFDPIHKKKLPKIPKRIGIVTSPTGAVIQDILNILTRRFAGFQLLLNPVKVQGEGAAFEIARAIDEFNRYQMADLLIIGRGGGSIEDLWAFNEEIVVKSIFESKIPIISAVGHETDFTLADYVADVRAPTPSAAAEIAIAEKAQLFKSLDSIEQAYRQHLVQHIRQGRSRLVALQKHPLFSSPYALLTQKIQQIDTMRSDLEESLREKIEKSRFTLLSCQNRLEFLQPRAQIAQLRQKLAGLSEHLLSLNPKNLLKKGYAILFSEKSHSVIFSAQELCPGQSFKALLHDGEIHAEIKK